MALTATDEHQHTIIVTKEFVRTICELLDERRQDTLSKELHDVHSADMADLVEALDEPHREALFDLCYSKFDVAVLVNLESPFQQWMVEHLGVQTTAKMLATLDTVSALDIVETLDEELQANLFSVLTKEQRAQIKEGLSFPENSAGRLMQRELIALPGHWTAQQAATYIRQSETLPKYIYKLYVIDKHHRPVGALTLKEIITADSKQPLNELVDEEMHPLHLDTPQRDVLYAFRQYALTACPVVDDQDRLVGIVTIDDVVDVIDEEAEKELYGVSRVSGDEFHDSVWDNAQKRLKWLVVTALTCFISSFTVSQFEGALQSKVALAILMSIVATMGGTVGMQVSTVAIRAIAMHDLRPGFIQPRVIKEVNIAALTGFISAALLGVVAFGWFGEMLLSIIFASSILFNMVWSGLVGVLIPVTLDRMGFDPALSAGTFVIMLADVLGYVAFLGLASYLVV